MMTSQSWYWLKTMLMSEYGVWVSYWRVGGEGDGERGKDVGDAATIFLLLASARTC